MKSGVRNHLNFGIRHFFRRKITVFGIGHIGNGVYVDRNVRLLRYPENISIGKNVILKEGVRICPAQPEAKIRIGAWTTIGYHSFLFSSAGIEIGTNCLVAPFCYLVDANHGLARGQLIRKQPISAAPIFIGDDVWLGSNVTILKGVTISDGAVVAAGTVVREDIPAYAVVSGNPASITGYRK